MNKKLEDKIVQYCFVKENIYKDYYHTPESDKGTYQDEPGDSCYFIKFRSIGKIGANGPDNHKGEIAMFRIYFNEDGTVELLFENNGYVDEVEDIKHLINLLDPKMLDLKIKK